MHYSLLRCENDKFTSQLACLRQAAWVNHTYWITPAGCMNCFSIQVGLTLSAYLRQAHKLVVFIGGIKKSMPEILSPCLWLFAFEVPTHCGHHMLMFSKVTNRTTGKEEVVVAGGQDKEWNIGTLTEIYNVEDGTWRVGTPLPEANAVMASLPYGDTFIIMGGVADYCSDKIYKV